MKDSETITVGSSLTMTCPSDRHVTELDLCRTGGCCPKVLVDKEGATILVPLKEMRTAELDGKTYYVVDLNKQEIDRLSMEMRRGR